MYQTILNHCKNAIQNNDFSYGYRKILDAIIATKNNGFYQKAFELSHLYYQQKSDFSNASLKLLDELEMFAEQTKIETSKSQYYIEAKGLKKKYQRGKFTLGEINLKVQQGELIGLVGENGNGKTTLLRILAKDLSYSSGGINSNFENETAYNQRTKLIYIPQRTPKRYGRVKDNLKFVAAHYGMKGETNEIKVLMSLARMGLWPYQNLKWSELSSGYKMRFELARVLLRNPRILLLDEPLANLDVLAQQVVLEDLKSLTTSFNPMAVLLSSQQLYEVEKIADQIVFLKNGTQGSQLNLQSEDYKLVIEIETNAERTVLVEHLEPDKIEFNGGYFVLFFKESSLEQVLKILLEQGITINYMRNITQSSRRFFV